MAIATLTFPAVPIITRYMVSANPHVELLG